MFPAGPSPLAEAWRQTAPTIPKPKPTVPKKRLPKELRPTIEQVMNALATARPRKKTLVEKFCMHCTIVGDHQRLQPVEGLEKRSECRDEDACEARIEAKP